MTSWHCIPAEVLVEIFKHCPDWTTLYSLMLVSRRTLGTFDRFTAEIVEAVLHGTMLREFEVIMVAVLRARAGCFEYPSYESVQRLIRTGTRGGRRRIRRRYYGPTAAGVSVCSSL
ncbi:hypothetical protein CDD82_2985 [Ophiocordyceps australis]|uniref:F-box domain-containing protein n=1 Tax=Ophiocordyceps australis TaxID=1399860 RepID=A0A2C5XUS2_9HYPO|nr:hypothetical protein CDD82_2985 [Ophiocordyceps australis]